jgi:hypothetical protein
MPNYPPLLKVVDDNILNHYFASSHIRYLPPNHYIPYTRKPTHDPRRL